VYGRINRRLRKRLDWLTPYEGHYSEALHLLREFRIENLDVQKELANRHNNERVL